MEDRVPRGLAHAVAVSEQEAREQEEERGGLDHERDEHDAPHEPPNVVVADGLRLGRRVEPRSNRELARQQEADKRSEDHDAEAAELDEQ